MLGMPYVIVLTFPLPNRGAWDAMSFSCTKAYGQSGPSSASSTSLQTASSRVLKWDWWGCAHMIVRPKTLLHLRVRLGAINRNAIYHLGFSALPHTPAWERVWSCACMIACICRFITTGQKLSEPHFILVDASHRLMSVKKSVKSLIMVCNEKKKNQLASSQ